MANFLVAQLDEMQAMHCACGFTRRAFVSPDNTVATLHVLDVRADAQKHYHKHLTQIYFVLEGEGLLELDDQRIPIKPMTAVMVRLGCRHRAIGHPRVAIIPVPAFDPSDKWFD